MFMVANLGRYVPGKVWQIAGLAYLAKREGVQAGVATGAAILGQGIAVLGAALVGLGVLLGANELWAGIGWGEWVVGIGGAVAIISVVVIPGLFRPVVAFWFRLTRTDPPDDGLGSLERGNAGLRWLTLYVLNWGIYATAFWLLYLSFGEWRTFLQVGPAFAAAYVAGYLAIFAPAGAGMRRPSPTFAVCPRRSPRFLHPYRAWKVGSRTSSAPRIQEGCSISGEASMRSFSMMPTVPRSPRS